MFQLSWSFVNKESGSTAGEGYYQSENMADVLAVLKAARATVDTNTHTTRVSQSAAPDDSSLADLARGYAEILKPA